MSKPKKFTQKSSKIRENMQKMTLGVLLVLVGAVFWAVSGVLAEFLFRSSYAVEWVSFYRLLCAGLILTALGFKGWKIQLFNDLRQVVSLFFFGLIGLLLTQFSYFKAIDYLDAGTATMIQYSAPIMIMLWVCLARKIAPKGKEILALVLVSVGIFLLASGGNGLSLNSWGVFWGIIGAVGVAWYSLGARAIIQRYGLLFVMGVASLIGALSLFAIFGGEFPHYEPNAKLYFTMAGIVLVGTVGAFCLYLKGLEFIGAVRASMIACIEPVAAAVMTWFFLGTSFTSIDIMAFGLILFSVYLNSRAK